MAWPIDRHKYLSEIARTALQVVLKHGITSASSDAATSAAETELGAKHVYADSHAAQGRIKRSLLTYLKNLELLNGNDAPTELGQAFARNELTVGETAFVILANRTATVGSTLVFPLQILLKFITVVEVVASDKAYLTRSDFAHLTDIKSVDELSNEKVLSLVGSRDSTNFSSFDVWCNLFLSSGLGEKQTVGGEERLFVTNMGLSKWLLKAYVGVAQPGVGEIVSPLLSRLIVHSRLHSDVLNKSAKQMLRCERAAVLYTLFVNIDESVLSRYLLMTDMKKDISSFMDSIGCDGATASPFAAFNGLEGLVASRLRKFHTETSTFFANLIKRERKMPTPYTKQQFLKEVFIKSEEYDVIDGLLETKCNLVLQGPPGVGKTFAARRLAWAKMGVTDDSRITFVQFHQSYSYEDFVAGFKPNASGGFSIAPGVFFRACQAAAADESHKYFFIIDEINRGNMSKVFGELLMLIESDKRGDQQEHPYAVKLPNSEMFDLSDRVFAEAFYVPDNLYLIGMMNTADRSLAMIDYALRRRFAFFEMTPGFGRDGFKAIKPDSSVDAKKYDAFINKIAELNDAIRAEFGDGFCIGHSYFCKGGMKKEDFENVVNYEIYPALKEYWFDDDSTPKKSEDWRQQLLGAL